MSVVNLKIKDSDFGVSTNSRADLYWKDRGFISLYKKIRSPLPALPAGDPYQVVRKKYQVKGIDFGNWVPIDMRYNYLIAAIVAMDDIEKITHVKFGRKVLSLAFGARGSGRALAHFEPGSNTINITRYSRDAGREGFIRSGGVGALAHEYGHFLDYFFGVRTKNKSGSRALSGGQSTATRFTPEELADKGAWGAMSNLLQAIIWNGKEQTTYYKRLKQYSDSEYWFRRNELFARAFEQYIQYRLQKKNITNAFLTQRKYEDVGDFYMRGDEFKRIIPYMDHLVQWFPNL